MTELQQIFFTSALTITGGIILLVAGQIITRFFIDPIHELHKLIGEIIDALVYYANIYSNPGVAQEERISEASRNLRQKASLLRARANVVPWYPFFSALHFVPHKNNIAKASSALIGLSNGLFRGGSPTENNQRRKEIIEALGLTYFE